ncbi:MAG: hypothetical protein LBJ10_10230 [Clostridiales bacterium]|jgi:hypothetical protein|nr:hypothetical protein [Clostridiales bacterium]
MVAWIGENIWYVCACMLCALIVFELARKLSFRMRHAGKHEDEHYFPAGRRSRILMVVMAIAASALFAASVIGSKSIVGLPLLFLPITKFTFGRLIYCADGTYYYTSDEFSIFNKDVKIEKPKWVREGEHAVLIFKAMATKPRLVQFNIPLEDARFFEEYSAGG